MTNIVTYKFKYDTDGKEFINQHIQRFNNLLRCCYKRGFGLEYSTKQMWEYQTTLNNVSTECGLRNGVLYKIKELYNQGRESLESLNIKRKKNKQFLRQSQEICFGGKKLFSDYNKGLITKEDFNKSRMFPIYSVGEKNQKGNRHFKLKNCHTVIFQPNKNNHIALHIKVNKKRQKDLEKLLELQESRVIPITYQLDYDYVYLSFDIDAVKQIQNYSAKQNRCMSIDINPNYIGYIISDWKGELDYKIVDSGVISIETLNKKDNLLKNKGLNSTSKERHYISNKRNYEICEVAKRLVNLAKHSKCEVFSFENLSIESSDKERGKRFNRLCNNQWCRNKLLEQIEKHCNLNRINVIKVEPAYSSFIGNMCYRQENLPDMCLAALEIGRRSYEFNLQYIKKTKEKKKNIIFPEVKLFQKRIAQALEEIGYIVKFDGLRELYYLIKNSKVKYRVPLSEEQAVFRFNSQKSYINLYSFR